MRLSLMRGLAPALFAATLLATAAPSAALAQFGVCGPPPLPPCQPERPPGDYDGPVRRGYSSPPGDRLGSLCRTESLRCRLEEPRRMGARCTCYDEDGEPERGRVVR